MYSTAPANNNYLSTDHLYLDVNLYNNSFADTSGTLMQYAPAEITETRCQDILKNPSEWNITIARFAISSAFVPRTFETIGAPQPWFVGLSYNGTYYTEQIIIPVVTNPIQIQRSEVYNVQAFLDLINAGFAAAQTAAQSGGSPTGPAGESVLMTYDNISQFYTLNVPPFYGTGGVGLTAGNGIGVHMSYALYQKFNSFNVIQNSPLLYAAGHNSDITFIREWVGNNYVPLLYPNGPTGIGPYMQLKQDGAWASSIENVNRLQVTVSQIPIVQEYVQTQNYLQGDGALSNQIAPVLTDFLIGFDGEGLRSLAQGYLYTPTLYRITSLQGNNPIRGFTIKIYVTTRTGLRIPLYIPPYGSMDLKLLFLKKSLSN